MAAASAAMTATRLIAPMTISRRRAARRSIAIIPPPAASRRGSAWAQNCAGGSERSRLFPGRQVGDRQRLRAGTVIERWIGERLGAALGSGALPAYGRAGLGVLAGGEVVDQLLERLRRQVFVVIVVDGRHRRVGAGPHA